MGNIIVSSALSVDGFASGPGGDISVMPLDESFNQHNAALIRTASSLLYGGTTYRMMVGYWPHVLGNPDASEAEQQIARRLADGLPVVAVSDSLTAEETGPWRDQTQIVSRADAHSTVAALRDKPGDTVIFGSLVTWTDLFAAGLIDELYLMIGPRIVAGDARTFVGLPPTDLRLLGVEQYPGSQNVILNYRVG